jgi:hypothetical protein
MISVSQGPNINASLAALDFNKKFEAGREGIREVAGAQEKKNEDIKTAFKDMTDNFEKAQITGSKVAAAIENNPELFAGLEDSNSLTAKSYQKFLNGDYSPQVVNNLNAYIDSAQTQITNASALQQQKDAQTAASALTDIIKLQFPEGMSDDEIDSVTQADLTRTLLNYISTKDFTPGAQEMILAGAQKYGQNLSAGGDYAYDAKIQSNQKAIADFETLFLAGDTAAALQVLSANPTFSDYLVKSKGDSMTGTPTQYRSAEEVAAIFGIYKPQKPEEPELDTGGEDTDAKDAALEALGTGDINDKKLTPYTNFKNKDLNEGITTQDQVNYANDLKDELKDIKDDIEKYQKKIDDRNFQNINVGSGSSRLFSASGGYTSSIDKNYLDNKIIELKARAVDVIGELDTMLKEDTTSALDTKSLVESAKLDAQ